ncbi:MAG: M14 family zinc carboxypeptidase [Bdellovibrionota bacterium]
MKSIVFGHTSSGLPIPAFQWDMPYPHVMIIGGVHGDEVEGVQAAYGLFEQFQKSYTYKLKLTLIPTLNLDGVLAKTRQNKRGVDLNRNLPTQDWTSDVLNPRYYPGPQANSEVENKALTQFIEKEKPRIIYSLHSWHPLLNINGKCRKEAEAIKNMTGYVIQEDIGYPTPGCLGTYAGLERDIPTLTYEIQRGLACEEILKVHVPAILEALKVTERMV